jgi:hypothetical protein
MPETVKQVVIQDMGCVGKYRARIVMTSAKNARAVLDIREYAIGANFEGFTRKGIRITVDDALQLRDVAQLFCEMMKQQPAAKPEA